MSARRLLVASLVVCVVCALLWRGVFAAAPPSWSTPSRSWTAGDLIKPADLNTIGTNLAALGNGFTGTSAGCSTADTTITNSTALVNVSGAAIGVSASEKWFFLVTVMETGPASSNVDFAFTGPASPTFVRYHVTGQSPLGGFASAFGTRVSIASPTTYRAVIVAGYLNNGANAGTVQLQAAQNVANVSTTTIASNACLMGWRMP